MTELITAAIGLALGSALTYVAAYHRGFSRGFVVAYFAWRDHELPEAEPHVAADVDGIVMEATGDTEERETERLNTIRALFRCPCAECIDADRELDAIASTPSGRSVWSRIRRTIEGAGW